MNDWKYRARLNVGLILKHAPDLIGFQEFQDGNKAVYDQEITGYEVALGPETARENDYGGYFLAIYWRANRFERLNSGHFYLSKTPEQYSRDWSIVHTRAVHWVHLRDKQSQIEFIHANTHFPHCSEVGRIESTHLTIQRMQEISRGHLPVFITADFNGRSTVFDPQWWDTLTPEQVAFVEAHAEMYAYRNNVYEKFARAGYVDTYLAAQQGDDPTTNTGHVYRGGDCPPINFRIDWILYLANSFEVQTRHCRILDEAEPPVYPSDHYPVLAEIDIRYNRPTP